MIYLAISVVTVLAVLVGLVAGDYWVLALPAVLLIAVWLKKREAE